jgi:hypothetical protein
MARYVPRLSIMTYRDFHSQNWQNVSVFMFKETEFIAVTAYMNKEVSIVYIHTLFVPIKTNQLQYQDLS